MEDGDGGFEIPRSPRTCSFRALFPSHPHAVISAGTFMPYTRCTLHTNIAWHLDLAITVAVTGEMKVH